MAKMDWGAAAKIIEAHSAGLGLQATSDSLEDLLDKGELTYSMHIDPRQVGFDPCNRAVMVHEIPGLMSDIGFTGWSYKMTAHALCCAETAGKTTIEDFNLEMCKGSDILAPVESGVIRFGSLACSHNNAGLRAIKYAMASPDPTMSEGGKWSLDKIRKLPHGEKCVRRWKRVCCGR